MEEFEIGDKVWWFEFPEQCVGKTKDITVCSDVFVRKDDSILYLENEMIGFNHVDVYKSKNDAIDAMVNYMQQLRGE